MFNFRPTKTPLGVPLLTSFELFGACYAVDMLGVVYRILTHDDDPEYWVWTEVVRLYSECNEI